MNAKVGIKSVIAGMVLALFTQLPDEFFNFFHFFICQTIANDAHVKFQILCRHMTGVLENDFAGDVLDRCLEQMSA